MGAQVVDYRVSTLVVLCKDCGHDVGLYPARHKCQPVERPAMPVLSSQYYSKKRLESPGSLELNARTNSSESSSSMASSTSPSFSSTETPTSKWSSRHQNSKRDDENEDSVYFNNFATNLSEKNETSGKKLWGKFRQNEKWKQLSEQNDKPKQAGKLWGKLIQATQNMADKIPLRDDRGPESDEDDWEGETHVSRILREHYERKRLRLPEWLFDEKLAVSRRASSSDRRSNDEISPVQQQQQYKQQPDGPMRAPSRRRLWEQNPDAKNMSSRERERQELRQAQPPMPPLSSENRSRYNREDYEDRGTSNGRYSNNRDNYEDDRYSHRSQHQDRDYERHSQPRNDDRYSNDRYKSNHYDDRDGHYSQGRDRCDTPPTPQTRSSRDQPRYDDDRYTQKPLYPLSRSGEQQQYQQQRSKSTSKPGYHHEDPSGYYSNYERSTKGQNQSEPRSDRYDQGSTELDDYYTSRRASSQFRDRAAGDYRYHSPSEMSRKEPLIKSASRRYGNDPSYF
ncbi:hypothetical protein BD408DRAFT_393134 [Parasitella parasitica]|nr:hypothetical protein BD408DRAFT_393134 [Parasitella parasitica]